MVHIDTQQGSPPSSQAEADTPHYAMADIIKCMRHSALMLHVADHDNRAFRELNQAQAQLLIAAATDLAAQMNEVE